MRQEDPLSSPLFNIVTHRLVERLPSDVGVSLGNTTFNATAFVDDLNLYASTPKGSQLMVDGVVQFLAVCGMSINTDKSSTLGFKPSGKHKMSTVDIKTEFKIAGVPLPKMGENDQWKYLGVHF